MQKLDWLLKLSRIRQDDFKNDPSSELTINALSKILKNPENVPKIGTEDYEYALDAMIHILPNVSSDKAKAIMKLVSVCYFGSKFLDKTTENREGVLDAYKQFKTENMEGASKNSEILNQILTLRKGDYGQIKKLIEESLISNEVDTVVKACKKIIAIEQEVESFTDRVYEA
mgnify:CR=1 FL=1